MTNLATSEILFGISVAVNLAWGVLYAAKCRSYNLRWRGYKETHHELAKNSITRLDDWKRRSLAAEKRCYSKRATDRARTPLK